VVTVEVGIQTQTKVVKVGTLTEIEVVLIGLKIEEENAIDSFEMI
jgi:hypothetical protein